MHGVRTLITALLLSAPCSAIASDRAWLRVFNDIATGVLTIRVDQTRAFDGQYNQSTEATGFVVDAERGIILTNRHVVNPGPVIARGLFNNGEEVPLQPLYRDPVHDFGFFRYDPAALRHSSPKPLKLAPEEALPGTSIWVIGNDDGEQLAVLQGTLARTDRTAPNYGWGRYNDFNTFYFQAASGMSGGSSGSPVVNRKGRVIALAAGANRASAASFFLPLDRALRALGLLQRGEVVPRGSLLATFERRTYAELKRGGLAATLEDRYRSRYPEIKGLLAVDALLPGSAAAERLEVGDVLLTIDGTEITDFNGLSQALDERVGTTIDLQVARRGETLNFAMPVSDLHTLTPDEYIEFDGAVVHQLSYQQARHYHRDLAALYITDPGFGLKNASLGLGDVLTSMNGQTMKSLDDLEAVLRATAAGSWTSGRFHPRAQPRSERFTNIRIDGRWYPARRCKRSDADGTWTCRDIDIASTTDSHDIQPAEPSQGNPLRNMFTNVRFEMPYWVSGLSASQQSGTGVIVDLDRGWVLVDRTTVPVAAGEVTITFGGNREVDGHLVYLHPTHNIAIIGYNPQKVSDLPLRQADLSGRRIEVGEAVTLAGLDSEHALATQETTVSTVRHRLFPSTSPPKFASATVRGARLANAPDHYEGVLLRADQRVGAFWLNYARQSGNKTTYTRLGIDAELVSDTLAHLRSGAPWRSLEVDWRAISLADARRTGTPDDAEAIWRKQSIEQLFSVARIGSGAPAASLLKVGDIVVSAGGSPPRSALDIERASQRPIAPLTVLREGRLLDLDVPTVALSGTGLDRLLIWGGVVMHAPRRALAMQLNQPTTGVYVGSYRFGSPASRFGLDAATRIVQVNGEPITTLDDLMLTLLATGHGEPLTLKTVNTIGEPKLVTLISDHLYWPLYEMRRDDDGTWRRWSAQDLLGAAPSGQPGATTEPAN